MSVKLYIETHDFPHFKAIVNDVTFTLQQTIRAQRGCRGIALLFL
jgi:hypothetical protein